MKKIINTCCILCCLIFSYSLFAQTIHVIEFNDFHGRVDSDHQSLGMAKFVTAIKQELKKYPEAIVVSGGDNYQGSALSNLSYGAIVSDMMKEIGITASAVGNHEFDWGTQHFIPWGKAGHFLYLEANGIDKKTHQLIPGTKPYMMVDRNGIKIAFIGLMTLETASTTLPNHIADLDFIEGAKAIQPWINYLKAGKDPHGIPNAIIALTHIPSYQDENTGEIFGEEITRLIKETQGLNAVISAHSHQLVVGRLNGIPVIQAACYGKALGELLLVFNDKTKRLTKIEPLMINLMPLKSTLSPDPEAQILYQTYLKRFQRELQHVLGISKVSFMRFPKDKTEKSLPLWACELLRQAYRADMVIQNQGFFRADILPGAITTSTLYRVFPFDNTIVLGKLSGRKIIELLESRGNETRENSSSLVYSGPKLVWNASHTRIIKAYLANGTPIIKNRYYLILTNNFLFQGGDHFDFSGLKDAHDTFVSIRDFIVATVKRQKIIR